MRDIARFFVRYQIDPENLLYLTREEQRTVLHLLDGSTVATRRRRSARGWATRILSTSARASPSERIRSSTSAGPASIP